MRRPAGLAAASVALALVLSGCTLNSLPDQGGLDKGYIAGSGVTEVKPADRNAPVEFSGGTESGGSFDSKEHLGSVVVVNFWYADCPPCRIEAKDLQRVASQYSSKGVVFVGINTRDAAAKASAYDSEFGVTYPSILDADSGDAQLAFSGSYRPNATPTTIVLDRQGRVAARIEGPITDQVSTLTTLIDSALAETSGAS